MNSIVVAVFFRLLPILVVLPVGPFRRVPLVIRLSLCILLSLLFSSKLPESTISLDLAVLMQEFLLGATIVFAFHSAFAAVHSFGYVLDTQMGTAVGAVFDPAQSQMNALAGETISIMLMMVFVWGGVHYDLFFALGKLFEVVAPGQGFTWRSEWLLVLGRQYVAGLILIGPIIISMWLVDFSLALMSRSMPQVQVYFLGLPLKIGIGLLLLAWLASNGFTKMYEFLVGSIDHWSLMIE